MKNITIVVATCGELTEKTCLWAIEPFKNEVEFHIIRNVSPQIKMLNQMIEGVQTEFFIPLDADIILYKDSYSRIKNAVNKNRHRNDWHSILFPLWDTLTQRRILALKVLRTSVMKEHLFVESATPDVEHYQRLTNAGYVCIDEYLKQRTIGNHVVIGHHFCYHKYRDLYQTYRSHNFEWDSGAFMGGWDLLSRAKSHYDFFMQSWIETENSDYLSCIAGMMDGILSPIENKSKNLSEKKYMFEADKWVTEIFFHWYMENHPKVKREDPILI